MQKIVPYRLFPPIYPLFLFYFCIFIKIKNIFISIFFLILLLNIKEYSLIQTIYIFTDLEKEKDE